jgi:hypothetical protein
MVVLFKKTYVILTVYCYNLSGRIYLKVGTTRPKAELNVPLRNLTKICFCKKTIEILAEVTIICITKIDKHPFIILHMLKMKPFIFIIKLHVL